MIWYIVGSISVPVVVFGYFSQMRRLRKLTRHVIVFARFESWYNNVCCVFWPAFRCCAHPKAGQTPFLAVFNLFCSFKTFFSDFMPEINVFIWTHIPRLRQRTSSTYYDNMEQHRSSHRGDLIIIITHYGGHGRSVFLVIGRFCPFTHKL